MAQHEEPLRAEAGRRGLLIPLAPFRARLGGEASLRKVLAALSVTEKVHAGRPRGMARTTRKAFSVLREGGVEYLVIPRVKGPIFLGRRKAGAAGPPLIDEIVAGADALPRARRLDAERCEPEEPLYEYQEAAVAHLCGPAGPLGPAAVAAHRASVGLQMDTGLGKSRIGLAVIARRGEPGLVVVPTQAIADQWVDEAAEVFPRLRSAVYHNPPKGSRRPAPGPATHDLVVVIVNTLREKSPAFMEGYGTLVIDESHEFHSVHNSRVLWLAQTDAVLALSATPLGRPDGLDQYVLLHLGPVLYPAAIPGFDVRAVNFRGEVRVVEYAGHPAHCETATTPSGTMSAVLTIKNIAEDPYRRRLVAAEVERLYRLHETAPPEELERLGLGPRPPGAATPTHPAGEVRRHGIFVFAELRDYLPALRAAIRERMPAAEVLAPELGEAAPGPRAGRAPARPDVSILRGGVSKATVSRARGAGAHIALTTYGFSRRGISLPDMTAIVKATPRRNGEEQVLGRATRRGSDESILRQVVDIVDTRTALKGQYPDRRKIYAKKGYPVAKVAAAWEDYGEPAAPAAAAPAPAADDDLGAMALDELLAAALGEPAPAPAPAGPIALAGLAAEDLGALAQ